jgi:glycosyltransferase involved in cell wall biosynthesis
MSKMRNNNNNCAPQAAHSSHICAPQAAHGRHIIPEIQVATVTNRGWSYLANVANNFKRQLYPHKKLIVILNSKTPTKEAVEQYLKDNNIPENLRQVFSMPEYSLGACLNYSVDMMVPTAKVWVKMDDDDFYGENYLVFQMKAMLKTGADIVGRRDMYIYVPEWKKAFFRKNGGHNQFTTWVQGASLCVKKHVFDKVQFPDKSRGEDTAFGHAARNAGFRTYAGPVKDFVVIRHASNDYHTWQLDLKDYLKNGRYDSRFPIKRIQQDHILYPRPQPTPAPRTAKELQKLIDKARKIKN